MEAVAPSLPDPPGLVPGTPVPPRPDLALWGPSAPPPIRRRGRRAVALALILSLLAGTLAAALPAIQHVFAPQGTAAEHKFLGRRADGSPTRWNPCEPVHYVVNLGRAPTGSIEDVHEAVRRISAATGIAFVYDGLTSEEPQRDRGAYLPGLYGDRWAPVVIAWEDPQDTNIPFQKNSETAAAVAKPLVPPTSEDVFVSGWVVVNQDDPNPPGFRLPGDQGPTVLHELGHVMGLDHVPQQGELMEPSGGWMTDLGPGDREGLREVGIDAGCLTTPESP